MKTYWKVFAAFLFCSMVLSAGFPQQQPPAMSVEKLTDNIYMVKGGSGANTGFFIGEKGVVVIDAKMTAESARQMIEEIKKLTPKPITTLVITHSDGDHVNGLGGFPQGLEIISHVQTKKDMEEAFKDPRSEALQPYLPNKTFTDKMDLRLGPERIQLLHFGPAHTSGDIVVFFPAEKVAFVGDLVFIGRDPLIHRQKGGTSLGLVKYLKALLELQADRYVSGHAEVVSKAEIETLIKSIEEKQAKIRSLIQEGKSLDEIKKIFGVEDRPAAPGGRRFMSLVEVIYLDIKETP
jgi:glyoxylase-like metal-dependent hydrolase (beta-lactamase superfamily II)